MPSLSDVYHCDGRNRRYQFIMKVSPLLPRTTGNLQCAVMFMSHVFAWAAVLCWLWVGWSVAVICCFMDGDRSQWSWSGLGLFFGVI